jgi:hypothetical protein
MVMFLSLLDFIGRHRAATEVGQLASSSALENSACRLRITINYLITITINLRRSHASQFLAVETFQEAQAQDSGKSGGAE